MLLLVRFRRLRNHWLSWLLLLVSLALNCFIGATPFVDNSGNTAGFVVGVLGCGGFLLLRKVRGMAIGSTERQEERTPVTLKQRAWDWGTGVGNRWSERTMP